MAPIKRLQVSELLWHYVTLLLSKKQIMACTSLIPVVEDASCPRAPPKPKFFSTSAALRRPLLLTQLFCIQLQSIPAI